MKTKKKKGREEKQRKKQNFPTRKALEYLQKKEDNK